MKHLQTFELYDPKWDYILYMTNDKENWIRVDGNLKRKFIALIKGEIPSFKIRATHSNRKFLVHLGEEEKTIARKKEKVVVFTTDEGIEDYIPIKTILNKLS